MLSLPTDARPEAFGSVTDFAPELLQLVEVGVMVDEMKLMVLGTGGNQKVACGHGEALAARKPGELARKGPDFGCCGNGLELLFDFAEQPLIPCIAGAVPQLEAHHVTEHRPIVGRNVADLSPDCRVSARPERFDPGRRINEEALVCAQESSRICRNSS
jgi:hypothetical protein